MPILTPKKAKELREKCKCYIASTRTGAYALSQYLYEARHGLVNTPSGATKFFAFWGFASWVDYLTTELKIPWEDAEKLIRVWETFGMRLAGKWAMSLLLDQCRMVTLLSLRGALTDANVEQWLLDASTLTLDALRRKIKSELGRPVRNQRRIRFEAEVTIHQSDIIWRVIHRIMQQDGNARRGDALYKMACKYGEDDGVLTAADVSGEV